VRPSRSTTYIVQHNLDLSGGTSGSPIFNASGEVVAINNSGIESVVLGVGGRPTRITQSSLGFGVRTDIIRNLLSQRRITVAKPASDPGVIAPLLDGRDVQSIRVVSVEELRDMLR